MSPPGASRDDLGFAGLLAAGLTPVEAWAEVRKTTAHPAVRAIIADLASTEDGRAALEFSRQRWARHGLRPPWEDPPDVVTGTAAADG
jgi:hypothetical protein